MNLFDIQKSSVLSASKEDFSRKGSVDEAIRRFIERLNDHPDLVTLSSCSGRIVVLREAPQAGKVTKKGCQWILVSHDSLSESKLWEVLADEVSKDLPGVVTFKFEPFILHLQCRTLELTKKLHTISLESGFKNTGLTVGKREKFVLAVRSAHGLELPLTDEQGKKIVSKEYCEVLTRSANAKLSVNRDRHEKLAKVCEQQLF